MDEKLILTEAMKAAATHADIAIEEVDRAAPATRQAADARVRVRARKARRTLLVEIKQHLNAAVVARLAERLQNGMDHWLIVTTHVTPTVARAMRELGLQFIDMAGNAFIDMPDAYVFVQGQKLPEHWAVAPPADDIWTPAGIKVAFVILCEPDLADEPYRAIAHRANVALGTVANVMKMLRARGYVAKTRDGDRRVRARKELLDAWTEAYATRLRPRTLVGRFTRRNDEKAGAFVLTPFGAQWGGEVAAEKLTGYLRPEVYTLWAGRDLPKLLVVLKLERDPAGTFEVRRKFWNDAHTGLQETVPDILVYGDLLATADARNVEAARLIYDQRIRRHLQID